MTEIISVRFKAGGKQYYFDPQGLEILSGEGVILDTSRGLEYGECSKGNHAVQDDALVQPLRTVVRVATDKDKEVVARNREKQDAAFKVCQEKISEHQLEMKLVDAEYSFEGNKILFFFTSEGRVDFRALVKDLASALHARIELRQIGVRDEAKMLGGLGICGKMFCCTQFLDEFQPVSIKMAKTQSLSLNPAKISGTCGRLMCCLKYEQNAYEDAVKRCPKQESFVETPDGVGTVTNVNLLREQVKVRIEDSSDPPKYYQTGEICVVRNGKGKRPEGYVAPPPEELAKLRKEVPAQEKPHRLGERSALSAALEDILAAPSAEPNVIQEAAPEGEGGGNSRRRRRSRSGKNPQGEGTQPKQDAPRQEKPKQEKPKQENPKQKQGQPAPKQTQEASAPKGEGGEKKPSSRRRRWGNKPKKGGPPPKAE